MRGLWSLNGIKMKIQYVFALHSMNARLSHACTSSVCDMHGVSCNMTVAMLLGWHHAGLHEVNTNVPYTHAMHVTSLHEPHVTRLPCHARYILGSLHYKSAAHAPLVCVLMNPKSPHCMLSLSLIISTTNLVPHVKFSHRQGQGCCG